MFLINPPKLRNESIPDGKLLIEDEGFEVRDLFKRINSKLCLSCSELGRKQDLETIDLLDLMPSLHRPMGDCQDGSYEWRLSMFVLSSAMHAPDPGQICNPSGAAETIMKGLLDHPEIWLNN